METRRVTQLIVVITLLSLFTMGCKNRNSSTNANTGLSSTQNNNISANSSSRVSKRFVGTWVEEGKTTDPGAKFTEDGKIIEMVGNQIAGTYTTAGDDRATIKMEDGSTFSATLESDTRMKVASARETAVFIKK